jgi:hypothetical protein
LLDFNRLLASEITHSYSIYGGQWQMANLWPSYHGANVPFGQSPLGQISIWANLPWYQFPMVLISHGASLQLSQYPMGQKAHGTSNDFIRKEICNENINMKVTRQLAIILAFVAL